MPLQSYLQSQHVYQTDHCKKLVQGLITRLGLTVQTSFIEATVFTKINEQGR